METEENSEVPINDDKENMETDSHVKDIGQKPFRRVNPSRTAKSSDEPQIAVLSDEQRRRRQGQLLKCINKKAKARLMKGGAGDHTLAATSKINSDEEVVWSNSLDLHPECLINNDVKLIYNVEKAVICMPFFGTVLDVPIRQIQSCSFTIEGNCAIIRFVFVRTPNIANVACDFMQSVLNSFKQATFRAKIGKCVSEEHSPVAHLKQLAKDLKQILQMNKREENASESSSSLQNELIIDSDPIALKDVFIRPNVFGKKTSGVLETHNNGFRFISDQGQKIDFCSNNVKHAFRVSCAEKSNASVHFHLKEAVKYEKKSLLDLQFYSEGDKSTSDGAVREQINNSFKDFCEKTLQKIGLIFERPSEKLSFVCVPAHSSTRVSPTRTTLVSLAEWPPFVLSMEDVELVHLERVNPGCRNFDMVFVMKDYKRKPVMINLVEMCGLANVKSWLDTLDMKYSVSSSQPKSSWTTIMKNVVENPETFFAKGGWKFLEPEIEEAENSGDEDDSSDSDDTDFDPDEESDYDTECSDTGEGNCEGDEDDEEQASDEDETGDSSDVDSEENSDDTIDEDEVAWLGADLKCAEEKSDPNIQSRKRPSDKAGPSSKRAK